MYVSVDKDRHHNESRCSTYFVEDGSYLKMKFIKLSYDLPTNWVKKIGASAINVYGQMENGALYDMN